MDEMNKKILNLMNDEAGYSYREIGETLGVSISTISNRCSNLEKKGVIKKCSYTVDYSAIGYDLNVIFHVKTNKNHINKDIHLNDNILNVYYLTGEYNLLMTGKFKSMDDLKEFIDDFRNDKVIVDMKVDIVLETVKEAEFVPRKIQ